MIPEYREDAARRLKVAQGHLASVSRMVDDERYCVDIMKQLAAVQASLEQVQQVILKNHLSTCVSDAIRLGTGEPLIAELLTAMKYSKGMWTAGDPEPSCAVAPPSPAVEAGAAGGAP